MSADLTLRQTEKRETGNTPVENKVEVSYSRRTLVQAGWAVPAILAVGLLPSKSKATFYVDGEGPFSGTVTIFGNETTGFPSIDCRTPCDIETVFTGTDGGFRIETTVIDP